MKRLTPIALALVLVACTARKSDTTATDTGATSTTTATTGTSADGAAGREQPTPPTATAAPATNQEKPMSHYENKVAVLHTTAGDIHVRFFPDVAPNHVKNFIDLAEKGFYDGTKFHRVIPGFMIQGGDPNTVKGDPSTWGMGGAETNIRAEFNSVYHRRGILSMARSGHPDSASSQFFIMHGDSPHLNGQYSAFGQVTQGMDVVDKIAAGPKSGDRPQNPVSITSVELRPATAEEQGPAPK